MTKSNIIGILVGGLILTISCFLGDNWLVDSYYPWMRVLQASIGVLGIIVVLISLPDSIRTGGLVRNRSLPLPPNARPKPKPRPTKPTYRI